ncbi:MAG: riboflavin kinase/FMN adenylyltransferase [Cryomorphaceae bacterium]|jgi:riboflavin kinase/FMN adenylyltransferase
MQILHDITELKRLDGSVHLALGVFDGVHVGHQEVILNAVNSAKLAGGRVGVVTFEPHPVRVLAPDRAPRRILASIEHKADLLASMGVDFLCVQEFTLDFAAREARGFIEDLVHHSSELKTIAVGEDWIFGKARGGNVSKLREWGTEMGFAVTAAAPVMMGGERVSSTRVRQAVRDGNLDAVREMLGRPYNVVGTVIEGKKLARQLGFPTANVVVHNEQLPPDGVWSLRVKCMGGFYDGIGNLGRRPTVEQEGARRLLEIHVFGYAGDLYDETIDAEFVSYIRKEKKFESIAELKAQIEVDVALAKRGVVK